MSIDGSPSVFIFIGRSGAGKGTQATLLMDALRKADPSRGVQYIQTGLELREFIKGSGFTEAETKKAYDTGALMPEFLTIYLWTKALVERRTGGEHIVFDGTPRRFHEAGVLSSVFSFYNLPKPFVINLEVSPEAALKRLLLRKRFDDSEAAIRNRLAWYETEVAPTVEFYRSDPGCRFLRIDGDRSVEEVHRDILEKTGLVR